MPKKFVTCEWFSNSYKALALNRSAQLEGVTVLINHVILFFSLKDLMKTVNKYPKQSHG